MALVGNDAGWTQISREQVPSLGSNVACGLAYTGEGASARLGGQEAVSVPAGCTCGGLNPCHHLTSSPLSEYHKAAMGLGARGLLLSRENEDQVVKVLHDAQQQCRDGHPVVVNILIGRTDFRDGSIAV